MNEIFQGEKYDKVKKIEYKGKIHVSKFCKDDPDNLFYELLKEIVIYKNLNHLNIPKIQHILINNEFDFEFLLELYDGDIENNDIISPTNFKSFLTQMLLTLHHIHSKGLFHSDIKPKNILFKENKKDKQDTKSNEINYYLIDYGLSEFYGFPYGESQYFSTELYKAIDFKTGENIEFNYDLNSDVFSLAAVCYKMLTGDDVKTIKSTRTKPIKMIREYDYKYIESIKTINSYIISYDKQKIVNLIGIEGAELLYHMLGLKGEYISTNDALSHSFLNIIVEPCNEIAFKNNFFVNSNIIINSKNINLEMHKKLIQKIIMEYPFESWDNMQPLFICNRLLRYLYNVDKINSNNFKMYGACSAFLCENIFGTPNFLRVVDKFVSDSEKTFKKEFCIIDIMKQVDWKIDMIPHSLYLDYYLTKIFDTNTDEYYLNINISKMLLLYITCFDNEIELTLAELSCHIIEITIFYHFKKKCNILYLYDKTLKIFNYLNKNGIYAKPLKMLQDFIKLESGIKLKGLMLN